MVGGGWSYFIFGASRSLVFRSAITFLLSSTIASLSWGWVYGLGGAIDYVNIAIVISSFLGWVAAWFKFRKSKGQKIKHTKVQSIQVDAVFMLVAIFAIFFVGLFPKMDSPTSLTMALRTGPDAVGTSIASDALLRDGSNHELELKVLKDSAFESRTDLLEPGSRNQWTIPSFSSQVKSEFILTVKRYGGSAAITANVLSLIGLKYLWSVTALLSTLSVLFGTFLIFDCLRSNKISVWLAGACSIAGSVNVNFLHVWNEGGMLQSWVFISLASIFFVLFTPNFDFSVKQRSILTSSAVIVLLLGHFDMLLLTLTFLSVFLFLSLIYKPAQSSQKDLNVLIIATVVGLIACGPYFFISLNNLMRRLTELGPGGWGMPVSPRLAEIFGLFNSYNLPYPQQGRTMVGVFTVDLLTYGLLIFLSTIFWRARKKLSVVFSFSIFVTLALVFHKTILIDFSKNYRYVKAVGFLAPLLFPLLGLTLKTPDTKNRFEKFILLSLCSLTLLASTNYILNYRQTSTRISHTMPEQLLASNHDLKLNNIDLVGDTTNLNIANFYPFVNLRWINRSTSFGVALKFNSHKNIGILISIDQCEQWECLRNLNSNNILNATEDFKILLLNTNSSILFNKDGRLKENYIDIINEISAEIHGPSFDSNSRIISKT